MASFEFGGGGLTAAIINGHGGTNGILGERPEDYFRWRISQVQGIYNRGSTAGTGRARVYLMAYDDYLNFIISGGVGPYDSVTLADTGSLATISTVHGFNGGASSAGSPVGTGTIAGNAFTEWTADAIIESYDMLVIDLSQLVSGDTVSIRICGEEELVFEGGY
jgi:hypothetical protein